MKRYVRILSCLLLLSLLAGLALPPCAQAESWPQENTADGEGRTVKVVHGDNGKTYVWELVGIFGGEDEKLKSIGFEPAKKVEIGDQTFVTELKKTGDKDSGGYVEELKEKRAKKRRSGRKPWKVRFSVSRRKAEGETGQVLVKERQEKRVHQIKIRNLTRPGETNQSPGEAETAVREAQAQTSEHVGQITLLSRMMDALRRHQKMKSIVGWTDPESLIYLQDNRGSGL